MADQIPAAAPQDFSFGSFSLTGYTLGFSGQSKHRSVVHEFPKRDGARVEDQGRAPRRLEVRLVWIGDTCAADFAEFDAKVHAAPKGLLVHPVAGQWMAFCEGPVADVEFAQAINQISVRVSFVETTIDTTAVGDGIPDTATAAQLVTASITAADTATGTYLGRLALAYPALTAAARATIERASAEVGSVTSSVGLLRTTISGVVASTTRLAGQAAAIASQFTALADQVEVYVSASNDLFAGNDTDAGSSQEAEAILAQVLDAGGALERTLLDSTPSPAGCAEAFEAIEETLAACLVLDAALKAARPPTILVVIPELIDLVTFAQRRYGRDALTRASDILALNQIRNPAAIPGGTLIRVPAR